MPITWVTTIRQFASPPPPPTVPVPHADHMAHMHITGITSVRINIMPHRRFQSQDSHSSHMALTWQSHGSRRIFPQFAHTCGHEYKGIVSNRKQKREVTDKGNAEITDLHDDCTPDVWKQAWDAAPTVHTHHLYRHQIRNQQIPLSATHHICTGKKLRKTMKGIKPCATIYLLCKAVR